MTNGTPNTPDTPRGNPWLPTIGVALWLTFVLALTLLQWRLVMISADGDPCLHWRIGNWIIKNHAVMRTEVLSYTRAGAPFIATEWLSEVAFAAAAALLGWNGIVLLAAMAIATSLWLLHRQLLLEGSDILLATGLTLLASSACSMHWLARPHVVSYVFVVLWAGQLQAFERGTLSARQLLLRLTPLMVLWANLHPGFLTGLILLAIYWTGAGVILLIGPKEQRATARRNMGALTLVGVSCFAASLANPHGWELHAHLADFLHQTKLVAYVDEFRSPNFHSGTTYGLSLMFGVLAIILIALRARLSPTEIILIAWAGCFALRWARNQPIFAIVVAPILGRHLTAWLTQAADSRLLERYRRICREIGELNRRSNGRWLVAATLMMLVLVMAKPRIVGGKPIVETELLTNRFPVAAVEFLRQNPAGVSGKVFNNYTWGGYLALKMPERKVFVDGRDDFYGPDLMLDFACLNEACIDCEAVLHKYDVGWTILPCAHPLNQYLALRTDWSVVYTDEVAVIYARKPG